MGMAAAVFFMKDDGAGLVAETQLSLDFFNSRFKDIDWYVCIGRRVEAQREEILCAFGAQGYGLCLFERSDQVLHQEAAHVMNSHMLIVACVQEMPRQIATIATLIADKDQDLRPSAVSSRERISRMQV